MKAVVKTAAEPGCVVWQEWTNPRPRAGQVVVEVLRAGICSTDVAIHDWTYRPREPVLVPSVLGHEGAGRVVEVTDGADGIQVGDRVALQVVWGHAHAPESLLGAENLDPRWYHLGASELGGAFAEQITIDAGRVIRLPSSVSLEDGALLEPAAVAAHAMELVGLVPGESVCLIGPGPFGLIMTQIARSAGAARIVSVGLAGIDEARLAMATSAGGADLQIVHRDDLIATADAVCEMIGREGADVVLDCGGTADSLPLALELAAPGGRVAVFGFAPSAEIEPLRHVIRKGLRLAGVSAAARRHYGVALRMIATETIKPSAIVSHTLPMSAVTRGIELIKARTATKVALVPDTDQQERFAG